MERHHLQISESTEMIKSNLTLRDRRGDTLLVRVEVRVGIGVRVWVRIGGRVGFGWGENWDYGLSRN